MTKAPGVRVQAQADSSSGPAPSPVPLLLSDPVPRHPHVPRTPDTPAQEMRDADPQRTQEAGAQGPVFSRLHGAFGASWKSPMSGGLHGWQQIGLLVCLDPARSPLRCCLLREALLAPLPAALPEAHPFRPLDKQLRAAPPDTPGGGPPGSRPCARHRRGTSSYALPVETCCKQGPREGPAEPVSSCRRWSAKGVSGICVAVSGE